MLTETNNLKVKRWKDKQWLIIQTEKLPNCLKFIQSSQFSSFEGIIVSRDLGYTSQDVSFLTKIPFIQSLSLSDNIKDISGIYSLLDLKVLNLAENDEPIDLSKFPVLRELSFDWSLKITNLARCQNLQKLIIGGFSPKTKSLAEIPPLPSLKEIKIVRSNASDLCGIERFTELENVELDCFNKLENIGSLACQKITTLVFSDCPQIKNHEAVKTMKNLEVLKFNNCGTMPSIKFIKELPKLNTFTFVNTIVEDGDIRPCFDLDFVGFSDTKHYSHTLDGIRKVISGRKSKF